MNDEPREIDRRSGLDRDAFFADFSRAPGCPVIVSDATDGWTARTEWTFDFFRQRFGGQLVVVVDRLVQTKRGRRVRLDRYLDYVVDPEGAPLVDPPPETPFYLTTFSPFVDRPDLCDDFDDPYFVDNWYRREPGPLRSWYEQGFGWVFIGPAGTLSPFHVDLFGTHAWLAQLQGHKRVVLLPPDQTDLADRVSVPFDASGELRTDVSMPGARTGVLAPGEVLFIPAGWPHAVISLEPSISLTFNFVDRSNFQRHMLEVGRQMPLWLKKLEANGGRERLGLGWPSPVFEATTP
ncbi:MAG: cupin-like domain-containing protein [Acidobacteriota bacterium]